MTSISENRCPLRGHPARLEPQGPLNNRYYVDCGICGPYIISETLRRTLSPEPSANDRAARFAAAAYISNCRDRGTSPDVLTTDSIKELESSYPALPSVEKVDRLLRMMAKDTPYPGARLRRKQLVHYAVLLRVSDTEIANLREFLGTSGYLSLGAQADTITPEAWRKIWREYEGGVTSRRGFVAMSFETSLEPAWDQGLRPGIADAKCEAIRIDKVHHNEKICDRIVAEIRGCGFVIADVTGHRQGVYFEAGLALGLGKPVIWTCRKDDLAGAHFDTRQYNHIVWESPADLRVQLGDRIKATILPQRPRDIEQ